MEHGDHAVVHDGAGVAHAGQLQLQVLLLQLVARDVVLQHRPLPVAGPHVGQHLARQVQVALQDPRLVVQLEQLQIGAQQLEPHVLPVFLPVEARQLGVQLGQTYAAADGPAGVDHLLRLEGEVVAEVGHRHPGGTAEVAVPDAAVAQVTGRNRSADVRQTAQPGRPDGLGRRLAPRGVGL